VAALEGTRASQRQQRSAITAGTRAAHVRKELPLACRLARWILAAAILLGWLGLYGYWLVSGAHPDCQVTTVTRAGTAAATTRSCGLPGTAGYIYVGAIVLLLLLPDAKAIRIAGASFERYDSAELPGALRVIVQAVSGDTPPARTPATDVVPEELIREVLQQDTAQTASSG